MLFILPGATRLRVCVSDTCVQTTRNQQYVVVVVVVVVVLVTYQFCVLFSLCLSLQAFLSKMDSPEKIGQTVQIGGLKFSPVK